MNISESMKRLLEKEEMSLKKIAEKTNVSESSLSEIKKGKRPNPGIETIVKICEGMKISIDEFIYGEKEGEIQTLLNEFKELDKKEQESLLTMFKGATHAVLEKRKVNNT